MVRVLVSRTTEPAGDNVAKLWTGLGTPKDEASSSALRFAGTDISYERCFRQTPTELLEALQRLAHLYAVALR
jgi:hypothetical protein